MRVAAGIWLVDREECRHVTVLLADAARLAGPGVDGVEVVWVSPGGIEERRPLTEAWGVPFERALPVRRFTSRKGQRHFSGLWWSVTTGGHVGFESWLERDHVMLLDLDPTVVGIASQPFWLGWRGEGGSWIRHVPDYFARRQDGSAVVVDCRPVERRAPRDVAKFEATAAACGELGWDYRLVGGLEPVMVGNVRWLAGYRHPRHALPGLAAALREVFAMPTPLLAGAQMVGDPIAVLPVLFNLLWRGELVADLSTVLHEATLVHLAVAR